MSKTVDEVVSELRLALVEYIEATYHIGDPALLTQRRRLLDEPGVVHQAPFLESTPRYKPGRALKEIKGLDAAALQVLQTLSAPGPGGKQLLYDPPYKHQGQTLERVLVESLSAVIMTGTGSGKTESFLMPIMGKLAREALARSDGFRTESAVRALILYPMNALVNDQLGRLRAIFGDPRVVTMFKGWAGRPPRFARYTSRTPYAGVRDKAKDQRNLKAFADFYVRLLEESRNSDLDKSGPASALIQSLKARGKWPAKPDVSRWFHGPGPFWQDKDGSFLRAITLLDDSELVTRHEVQAAAPDLMVTNYSMLEYMMMRPVERTIFDQTRAWLQKNPQEKFLLILDEAHLYRGAAGAEVGLLLRRLRDRLDIPADRLQVICATASFSSPTYAPKFASQLTGVPESTFLVIEGEKLERPGAAVGSKAEAELLASLDMTTGGYYSESEALRQQAVEPFLSQRGVAATTGDLGPALYRTLQGFAPLAELVNHTMGQARPVSDLGKHLFPGVATHVADLAATNLAALASNARVNPDDPSLLPCRVHSFFRGLRGLWACMDPKCPEIDAPLHGVAGKLYAQPRQLCACNARVLELFTCRQCGTAYARGYSDDPESPKSIWSEPGARLRSAVGELEELGPLDLMLEKPGSMELGEAADLDLVTGQINPQTLGSRMRRVYLPPNRTAGAVTDDEDGDDSYIATAGVFHQCGMCERKSFQGRSPVQDHETKGDQPFQVLLGKQLQVQPPGPQSATRFAPMRGRKVLAFSDSRQVAARLAPNLQMYAARDSLRPLMVRGWTRLSQLKGLQLRLDDIYAAVMIAACELDVRLRPELELQETFSDYPEVVGKVGAGVLDSDEDLKELCNELRAGDGPPQMLLADILSTLRDRSLGLEALAFASIVERADKRAAVEKLPDIPGIAEDAATKVSLARAWLREWGGAGFWLPSMTPRWYLQHPDGKVRVSPRSGTFRRFDRWLGAPATRKVFKEKWLPELLKTFTEQMEPGKHRLVGKHLTLLLGGEWVRCADCKSVHRPMGVVNRCLDCGHPATLPLNPETDEVFAKRKGYYRRGVQAALGANPQAPMALIAAEHTAQLNAAGNEGVFSKSEENELLFQDVELNGADGRGNATAIDVLSSTTTMEVGIDIGQLSGVALRNMPPGRANYQQRAGRAGRRGNAIATVMAFGGSDTHDEHFFSEPAGMISGPVVDPTLTLDNLDISKRHVRAYLLQSYHQARIPAVATHQDKGGLFSVLGQVTDFLRPNSPINRDDFEVWLKQNEAALRARVAGWMPTELTDADKAVLLDGMVEDCLREIDMALHERGERSQQPEPEIDPIDSLEQQAEVGEEKAAVPGAQGANRALLDTLLYKGVLPRYAFPTDVATFHVFNLERSTRFRPQLEFAPSQSQAVALTQYAPGKQVWISGKCYTSGAIYAPFDADRRRQWTDRRLHLECSRCGFARTEELNQGIDKGDVRDCEACEGQKTLGPARYWMRPAGFAHPVDVAPVTSPDDMPETSYATRAKLTMKSPDDSAWTVVNERIRYMTTRTHLLVSNTGPARKGYSYCTSCGRIESTSERTGLLSSSHAKPYPDEKQPRCSGGYTSEGIVLGTDFVTDVALFSLRTQDPVRLRAGDTITQISLRTLSEALARAACDILGVDPGEIQAEYRPALSPQGVLGLETEIFLYDTLAGGAGFAKEAAGHGQALFDLALTKMSGCPEGSKCDLSCYRCLRTFRNRIDHSALDRHTGRALLEFLLTGQTADFDDQRLHSATTLLCEDLARQDLPGWAVRQLGPLPLTAASTPLLPIEIVDAHDHHYLITVSNPLEERLDAVSAVPPGSPWQSLVEVSELTVRKNLPEATTQVLRELRRLGAT
jgi:ATP-dependent helicase YprA (DUF1998 family)